MDLHEEVEKVGTKEEFINFIELLIEDFKVNPNDWENNNLTSYLFALSSWIDDMEGYFINNDLPIPEDCNWKLFATALYAAKLYE